MKKLKTILLSSLMLTAFIACDKKDDTTDSGNNNNNGNGNGNGNGESSSYVEYNNKKHETPKAWVELYGQDPESNVYDRDLNFSNIEAEVLYSEDTTITIDNINYVYLDINNSLTSTEIETGTYTLDSTRAAGKIVDAYVIIDSDYDASTGTITPNEGGVELTYDNIAFEKASATVEIAKTSTGEYTVNYTLGFDGVVVTGTYQGEITKEFDYSDDERKSPIQKAFSKK